MTESATVSGMGSNPASALSTRMRPRTDEAIAIGHGMPRTTRLGARSSRRGSMSTHALCGTSVQWRSRTAPKRPMSSSGWPAIQMPSRTKTGPRPASCSSES